MKILMITDKMGIGGAETHIVTLARELVALGHSVTVISATGAYTKSLIALGIRCVYAPADARDPISVLRVKQTVAQHMRECDVVHAHTRFTAFIAKSIRGRGTYPPIAVTAHLDFPTFPYGAVSYFGDSALAVSEDIKEHLIKKYRVPSGTRYFYISGLKEGISCNLNKFILCFTCLGIK